MTFEQFEALDFAVEWRRLSPDQQEAIGTTMLRHQAAYTVTQDDDPGITTEQFRKASDIEGALLNSFDELFERSAPNIPWWAPEQPASNS